MCREKNPGLRNSKQQKQNQTVFGCSVHNAEISEQPFSPITSPADGSTVPVIDLLVLVCTKTQKFLGFELTNSKLLVSRSDAVVLKSAIRWQQFSTSATILLWTPINEQCVQ